MLGVFIIAAATEEGTTTARQHYPAAAHELLRNWTNTKYFICLSEQIKQFAMQAMHPGNYSLDKV